MSKAWRKDIANDVAKHYALKQHNQQEESRLDAEMRERKRSARELEVPVDKFINHNQGVYQW